MRFGVWVLRFRIWCWTFLSSIPDASPSKDDEGCCDGSDGADDDDGDGDGDGDA